VDKMSWIEILKDEDFLKDLEHKYKGMFSFLKGKVIVEPANAYQMEMTDEDDTYRANDEQAIFMALFMEASTPKKYRLTISVMETDEGEYTGQLAISGRTLMVAPYHDEKEIEDWLETALRYCHHMYNSKEW
tara:strand:+ start:1982 stop:2377 length:396 start_codon:yes stop_codon:yes gene_type:complete